jgi:hypothetical protein
MISWQSVLRISSLLSGAVIIGSAEALGEVTWPKNGKPLSAYTFRPALALLWESPGDWVNLESAASPGKDRSGIGTRCRPYLCSYRPENCRSKIASRVGCQYFHESARGGLVKGSHQFQFFALGVEHPVMIVTLSKLQLFVIILDPSTDRSRFVEIEWGAGNRLQFSGWDQTLINGCELTGLDHQLMP